MSAAGQAAAALGPELAAELVAKVPLEGEDPLADDLAATQPEPPAPAPTPPPAAEASPALVPEPGAAVEEAEPFELPNYRPVDLDDEEDEELTLGPTDLEDEETDEETGVYQDPDELARENARLRKQVAAQDKQRAVEMQRTWAARYKDRYPLADFDLIQAPSRRAFEREAAKSHNRNYEKLKPAIDKLQEAYGRIADEATSAARAEVTDAWGKPTVGPALVPVQANERQAELEAARRTGNLSKVLGVLRKQYE